VPASSRPPVRGEIWFVQLHIDPPEMGRRPVVIVSHDARNRNQRAHSVLAVPLTSAGENGLQSDSAACAEDVTVVLLANVVEVSAALSCLP
jgi:mRNA-degrading endonuclease toxin of MazEF toxin-antitoxin module